MAIYAIGDIQGCFTAFQNLLAQIKFDATEDTLWFTGDLVNRGPQSLQVLRFVKDLGDKHKTVLGNHDLHLLAVATGAQAVNSYDTLDAILTAPDKDELIAWLRHRPMLIAEHGYVMTHAGLAPQWDLAKAKMLAKEVETELQKREFASFLKKMYGNQPDQWNDALVGMERWRCITNYFTRMRFCYKDGRLNLSYKGTIASKPEDVIPWFNVPNRANANLKIIFGHWAALGGKVDVSNLYPLDTGCVWGNCLTAMRLDNEKHFSVNCL